MGRIECLRPRKSRTGYGMVERLGLRLGGGRGGKGSLRFGRGGGIGEEGNLLRNGAT